MRRNFYSLLPLVALSLSAPAQLSATAPSSVAASDAALQELADQIELPHEMFVLDNGLTVLVHENRKAPVVAVSVWYNVGSKDEPAGKTGFAHLFEHLMFNGSENLPEDYFVYLTQIGATGTNGTTSFDRTNYYETVPKGALERVLFMESDRMGYLLGAVTQEKLDNQRGVVQNEKRQNENQPGGLAFGELLKALFPVGHPYHHTTIGSMADIQGATLGDVQEWFENKYGPNNAILVLSGDIDAAEARPLVEKYFGGIERGPQNVPVDAAVPTLPEPKRLVMQDKLASTKVSRIWAVPGLLGDDGEMLDVASTILGGAASSRLYDELVRDEQIATGASASYQPFHRVGLFSVGATVKEGQDPDYVEQRLAEVLAEFVEEGPTEDELARAKTGIFSRTIRGLEHIATAGNILAENQLYEGDTAGFQESLDIYAGMTSEQIQAALQRWVTRPALTFILEPGERPAYVEAEEAVATNTDSAPTMTYTKTEREIPEIGETPALDFPDIVHTSLSNGIELHYAQRDDVPLTRINIRFDAGRSADPADKSGLASMTMGLLTDGAGPYDAQALAEAQEKLGTSIRAGGGRDESSVAISTLSPRLAESLELMRTVIREPRFAQEDIERSKAQRLSAIAQSESDPNGLIGKLLPQLIYGPDHPYAAEVFGDADAIETFTAQDLRTFHETWIRPDRAEIFVVSDLSVEKIKAALEREFGNWPVPAVPAGVKAFPALPPRPDTPRILLVDRPNSPQSRIVASQLLPIDPQADLIDLSAANEALGSGILSRFNTDLRETKGWSYGVRGSLTRADQSVSYSITAPVQADKTAESVLALQDQIDTFLHERGVTEEELERIVTNNVGQLPGEFQSGSSVLSAMVRNDELGRPDDYYETLADKYRSQTRQTLDAAMRNALDPDGFIWMIVGEADKIRPQMEAAGLEYEEVSSEGVIE